MPLENYGAIQRAAAWAPASVPNAFQQGRQNAQQNALFNYDFQRKQQEDAKSDAEERAWDQAVQNRDIQTMLQIDPETTQLLQQHWGMGPKPAPIEETTLPSGRVLAVQGGTPIGSPWAPQEKGVGTLYDVPGPDGRPIRVPAEQAVGQPAYREPKTAGGGFGNAPSGYRFNPDGSLAPIPGGPADPSSTGHSRQNTKDTAVLRKEFRGLQSVKDYETVLPLLVSGRNAPKTPAGDLQLIYTLGKILDPGSVVREGELQLTQNAQPWFSKVVGEWQKQVRGGAVLPDGVRSELLAAANERANAYRQAYQRDYDAYAELAGKSGLVPRDVVGRHAANAYQTKPGEGQAKTSARAEAPAQAVEYLRAHPETKAAFRAKYGYLPDGI